MSGLELWLGAQNVGAPTLGRELMSGLELWLGAQPVRVPSLGRELMGVQLVCARTGLAGS